MKRIRRVLVVAIIGVVMLGFGMITTVDADQPPFMPPDYYAVPGYPDASNINGRIFAGYFYDLTAPFPWNTFNVFEESDVSFIFTGWIYWQDELELFPHPLRVHVWIKPVGSDDWVEVKLSRIARGHGNLEDWAPPEWLDGRLAGPAYQWYTYFEPGYWEPGEYDTHIQYTCKDPNSPKNKEMIVWDLESGDLLDFYGRFLVQEVP